MTNSPIKIKWPNGENTSAIEGDDWIEVAKKANIEIPLGCLGGSCGACEIEVNGEVIRPCINSIKKTNEEILNVDFYSDPFW